MKLAVEARYIRFILGDNNVAVIVKRPVMTTVGCGVRHTITWRSSFLLRGGVKLFPADQIIEVDGRAYHAVALRKLGYATIALVDNEGEITYSNVDEKGNILAKPVKRYKWRQLEKPELVADGYLVFMINGNEAKLVNDDPTHVLFIIDHKVHSRVYDADIKITPQDIVVFKDVTSCKTESVALAIVIAPINTNFTLCYNKAPYRYGGFEPYYDCYMVKATVPPAYEFLVKTPAPEHISTSPDEVI
jgi:hypothetical protein